MAAIMVFEGFKPMDAMTEIHGEMLFDVLGLTKADMEGFPSLNIHKLWNILSPLLIPR